MQVRAATPLTVQVANTAPDSSPTTTTNDHVTQLQQLAQLRDAGILTDEEFASKKQEILSRI
jgi:hypothetical protein